MPKILIVTTSHSRLGDTGQPTGLWLEELATPYYTLGGSGLANGDTLSETDRSYDFTGFDQGRCGPDRPEERRAGRRRSRLHRALPLRP